MPETKLIYDNLMLIKYQRLLIVFYINNNTDREIDEFKFRDMFTKFMLPLTN